MCEGKEEEEERKKERKKEGKKEEERNRNLCSIFLTLRGNDGTPGL